MGVHPRMVLGPNISFDISKSVEVDSASNHAQVYIRNTTSSCFSIHERLYFNMYFHRIYLLNIYFGKIFTCVEFEDVMLSINPWKDLWSDSISFKIVEATDSSIFRIFAFLLSVCLLLFDICATTTCDFLCPEVLNDISQNRHLNGFAPNGKISKR